MSFAERLRAHLPTVADLERHPWLKPVAHRLHDKSLWQPQPEALARGAAIGVFWAFATPLAQIVFAAAHCVWWRANIPVATLVTLITNPLTVGGWLWLAYQLGVRLIGEPAEASGWVANFGWPIVAGMAILAVGGAVAAYVLVRAGAEAWRMVRRPAP